MPLLPAHHILGIFPEALGHPLISPTQTRYTGACMDAAPQADPRPLLGLAISPRPAPLDSAQLHIC